MAHTKEKKEYQAPTLQKMGKVADITLGPKNGYTPKNK